MFYKEHVFTHGIKQVFQYKFNIATARFTEIN